MVAILELKTLLIKMGPLHSLPDISMISLQTLQKAILRPNFSLGGLRKIGYQEQTKTNTSEVLLWIFGDKLPRTVRELQKVTAGEQVSKVAIKNQSLLSNL